MLNFVILKLYVYNDMTKPDDKYSTNNFIYDYTQLTSPTME